MAIKLILAGMAVAAAYRGQEEQEERGPVVAQRSGGMAMEAAPIDPSWVISGNPQARISRHSRSQDGMALTALWDCTAGEFRWFFAVDETVVIQDGEVHVTAEDGTETVLTAGDIAFFKANTWAVWRVDSYVRKVAFLRRPLPDSITSLLRIRDRLKNALARG